MPKDLTSLGVPRHSSKGAKFPIPTFTPKRLISSMFIQDCRDHRLLQIEARDGTQRDSARGSRAMHAATMGNVWRAFGNPMSIFQK